MRYSKRRIAIAALLFFSCSRIPDAEAVPAAPVVHTNAQKDGTTVRYRLNGDEFLNYMTDSSGNLVAFGDDGDLYMADWVSERDFGDADSLSDAVVPTGQKAAAAVEARNAPPSESGANYTGARVPDYILERVRRERAERGRARREQFGD